MPLPAESTHSRLVHLVCTAVIGLAALPSPALPQPATGSAVSFRAGGNEPGWTLDIGGNRLVLVADYGATRIETTGASPVPVAGGRRYDARTDAHTVVVTVLERVCADTMTGMPRPATVEVLLDGRVLRGCGGDPSSLLRGGLWTVTQLGGQPIVAMSRMTLAFGAGGRVTGSASCNTYTAGYLMTGEGITITMPISGLRSCEAPYMAQEAVFLEGLRGVQRFELTPDGTLTLHGADGGAITARREDAATIAPKRPARPR